MSPSLGSLQVRHVCLIGAVVSGFLQAAHVMNEVSEVSIILTFIADSISLSISLYFVRWWDIGTNSIATRMTCFPYRERSRLTPE
jgi:hypothetical protein